MGDDAGYEEPDRGDRCSASRNSGMPHPQPKFMSGSTDPESPSTVRTKDLDPSTNGRRACNNVAGVALCGMARRSKSIPRASRDTPAARVARWLLLALAGIILGLALGNLATGGLRAGRLAASIPFSSLSANPDAAVPPTSRAEPCRGCPDSYGVAARMRASRERRMTQEFRELGYVEVDTGSPAESDGYRYGGRFPDSAPLLPLSETQQPRSQGADDPPRQTGEE